MIRKNSIYLFKYLCILFLCLYAVSCQPDVNPKSEEVDNPFKMVIRLWPDHHKDTVLCNQLVESLSAYPGACDEVWFCTELGVYPMEKHRQSAEAMAVAMKKMNRIGVKSSIQIAVSIGHGDGLFGDFSGIQWGKIVGKDGVESRQCNCPRQPGFLDYMEELAAVYGANKPAALWIDDDLRVATHLPVQELCYCSTCINLFNQYNSSSWTRETLVKALNNNVNNGELRRKWILFGQESLAGVARAVARGVHRVSPETQMGQQHYNGHRDLLNGYDWKLVFDAMKEETGINPASRPGNGFYNDHAPREMIVKGYDMARQIRRLPDYVKDITAEVEGFQHWATGKSPHGLAIESFLYLAMGCNQLSYAIICSAVEPMEWYASNYFKELASWRSFYKEYAGFNQGSQPGGLLPYISKEHALHSMEGEPDWKWSSCNTGSMIYSLAPLGLPFCPDGDFPVASIIDPEAMNGLSDSEMITFLKKGSVLFGDGTLALLEKRKLLSLLQPVAIPEGLDQSGFQFFETENKGRIAFISFNPNISNRQRLLLLRTADWVSGGRLPVIIETMAQMQAIPRITENGSLRSVAFINTSISRQNETLVRLRGCPDHGCKITWVSQNNHTSELAQHQESGDILVTLPPVDAWNGGWLRIESN